MSIAAVLTHKLIDGTLYAETQHAFSISIFSLLDSIIVRCSLSCVLTIRNMRINTVSIIGANNELAICERGGIAKLWAVRVRAGACYCSVGKLFTRPAGLQFSFGQAAASANLPAGAHDYIIPLCPSSSPPQNILCVVFSKSAPSTQEDIGAEVEKSALQSCVHGKARPSSMPPPPGQERGDAHASMPALPDLVQSPEAVVCIGPSVYNTRLEIVLYFIYTRMHVCTY